MLRGLGLLTIQGRSESIGVGNIGALLTVERDGCGCLRYDNSEGSVTLA